VPTAGYSGTPLARKLGIRAGSRVLVVRAPTDLDLEPLPSDVVVHARPGKTPYDVVVDFCRDRRELERSFGPLVARLTTPGGLWVAWPKRASGVPTDLTEGSVREHGLGVGLVDTKVAAIDDVWAGLRFVRRLPDR
jgi:hypothetical protein